MIPITDEISIDESELTFDFVRTAGPGGQHVNKSATGVQLRFDVAHASSLPEEVRERLKRLAGSRITGDGILIIDARESRSQHQNREAAVARLVALVRQAARRRKKRHKTRPSTAARQQRLAEKRRRSEIKRRRRDVTLDD